MVQLCDYVRKGLHVLFFFMSPHKELSGIIFPAGKTNFLSILCKA